jgi:hypothetical protein
MTKSISMRPNLACASVRLSEDSSPERAKDWLGANGDWLNHRRLAARCQTHSTALGTRLSAASNRPAWSYLQPSDRKLGRLQASAPIAKAPIDDYNATFSPAMALLAGY